MKGTDINRLMQRYEGAVPGASLLVIRDGKPVLQRSYGRANLEKDVPATAATNYRLASVTKQFTAAAVLLLVEEGKLGLEDRVRTWLPSLPVAVEAVTIRQMLTHRAGLVDYEDLMAEDYPGQVRDADVLRLLEAEPRTYFSPGSRYRYSNSGYALLALIVERVSGRSFLRFLRERIFAPLAMHDTLAYVRGGPEIARRAYGYSLIDGRWTRTDQSATSAVLGDGGIYSSALDLAKWDAALYDNRLLGEQARRLAFKPWTPTDAPNVAYGFGWRITGDSVWHSGETIGFRNVILRYPKRRLTVILLTNRDDPEPYGTALAIAESYRAAHD